MWLLWTYPVTIYRQLIQMTLCSPYTTSPWQSLQAGLTILTHAGFVASHYVNMLLGLTQFIKELDQIEDHCIWITRKE